MGNCCRRRNYSKLKSNDDNSESIKKKQQDLICRNQQNVTIIKDEGSLIGERFIIESCQNCQIYILDWTNSIIIEDCLNCKIFIGPSKSVFIKNSKECSMVIACKQYRSARCEVMKTLLYCEDQPVLEYCKNMQFGCFYFSYPSLTQQFKNCELTPWTNNWSDIYDFTNSSKNHLNYSFLPENEIEIIPYICEQLNHLCTREYYENKSNLSVPITLGKRVIESFIFDSVGILIYPKTAENLKNSLIPSFNLRKDIQIVRSLDCKLENDQKYEKIFNSTQRERLNSKHDFSKSSIFVQLTGESIKQIEQAILDIFKNQTEKDQYRIWNSNDKVFQEVLSIIFGENGIN